LRGRILAACAALLVGLAPAGGLLSMPWVSGEALLCLDTAPARESRRDVSEVPALVEQGLGAPTPVAVAVDLRADDLVEAAPLIWRSPSGPAPSTAPPHA
jgi:hypothetical protein